MLPDNTVAKSHGFTQTQPGLSGADTAHEIWSGASVAQVRVIS